MRILPVFLGALISATFAGGDCPPWTFTCGDCAVIGAVESMTGGITCPIDPFGLGDDPNCTQWTFLPTSTCYNANDPSACNGYICCPEFTSGWVICTLTWTQQQAQGGYICQPHLKCLKYCCVAEPTVVWTPHYCGDERDGWWVTPRCD